MFSGLRRGFFLRYYAVIRRDITTIILSWVVFCVFSVVIATWASHHRKTKNREESAMMSPLPNWVYNSPREPPPNISGSTVYFWINNTLKGIPNFCSDFDIYSTAEMEYDGQTWSIYYPGDVKHLQSRLAKLELMMNSSHVQEAISTLKSDPDTGVIDVSFQSSLFALYAALKGHNVMVINPQLENVLGVWKTLNMNNVTDRTTIFFTSPTLEKRPLSLQKPTICDTFPLNRFNNKENSREILLPGILLDDVLPFVNFEDVLFVMDQRMNQYDLLEGGEDLFQGANVFGVVMEMRLGVEENEDNVEDVRDFMDAWDLKPYEDSKESDELHYLYFGF